jgi:hypothetical protein
VLRLFDHVGAQRVDGDEDHDRVGGQERRALCGTRALFFTLLEPAREVSGYFLRFGRAHGVEVGHPGREHRGVEAVELREHGARRERNHRPGGEHTQHEPYAVADPPRNAKLLRKARAAEGDGAERAGRERDEQMHRRVAVFEHMRIREQQRHPCSRAGEAQQRTRKQRTERRSQRHRQREQHAEHDLAA